MGPGFKTSESVYTLSGAVGAILMSVSDDSPLVRLGGVLALGFVVGMYNLARAMAKKEGK
jgi:hypothetical protein